MGMQAMAGMERADYNIVESFVCVTSMLVFLFREADQFHRSPANAEIAAHLRGNIGYPSHFP